MAALVALAITVSAAPVAKHPPALDANISVVHEAQISSCLAWNRPGYSWTRITQRAIDAGLEAVALSDLAYALEGAQSSWTAEVTAIHNRMTHITPAQHEGAFGYFGILDGTTPVIGFAGTDPSSWDDVRADVESGVSETVTWSGSGQAEISYTIGQGFNRQFQSIIGTIESAVNQRGGLDQYQHRLLVVGHSLGGALANIAAVYFADRHSARVMLRTFGAPRVFSWATTADIQARLTRTNTDDSVAPPPTAGLCTQRWVNYGDPVPSLPPCETALGTGYHHMGNGAFSLYQSWGGSPRAYGPQHMDYTPYQSGAVARHITTSYMNRMVAARASAPA